MSGQQRRDFHRRRALTSFDDAPPASAHPRPRSATRRRSRAACPSSGSPLALIDYERTLDWIDAAVERRQRGYVCVAAVHTVVACQDDPELRAAVLGADLTVPDGMPLVWALRAARACDSRAASTAPT